MQTSSKPLALALASALLWSLGLARSAAAGVLVVDAGSAPGADFTAIQAAVDAALEGDTVLVRDGVYASFRITGKALRVVADGASVRIQSSHATPSVRVSDLLPGQDVLVRGFSVRFGVSVERCDGAVWLDDVHGERTVTQCTDGLPGAFLDRSQRVTFTRCTLVGSSNYSGLGGDVAAAGLFATQATAQLFDCAVFGATGTSQYSNGLGSGPARPGAAGLWIAGATVTVVGCELQGGGGGIAAPLCSGNHARGGAGVAFTAAGGTLRSAASTAVGGQTDLDLLCPGLHGPAGPAVEGPGTIVALPGLARPLRADGPVRGGGTLTLALEGQAGELPFVLVSSSHEPLALWNGALVVGLPPGEMLALPALPSSGATSIAFAVPNVGPLLEGVCLYLQGVFVAPGEVWPGGATSAVLLDAAL